MEVITNFSAIIIYFTFYNGEHQSYSIRNIIVEHLSVNAFLYLTKF